MASLYQSFLKLIPVADQGGMQRNSRSGETMSLRLDLEPRQGVRNRFLPAGDRAGIECLVGYVTRCPLEPLAAGQGDETSKRGRS